MTKKSTPYREREKLLYIFFLRIGKEKIDIIDTTIDYQLVRLKKTS